MFVGQLQRCLDVAIREAYIPLGPSRPPPSPAHHAARHGGRTPNNIGPRHGRQEMDSCRAPPGRSQGMEQQPLAGALDVQGGRKGPGVMQGQTLRTRPGLGRQQYTTPPCRHLNRHVAPTLTQLILDLSVVYSQTLNPRPGRSPRQAGCWSAGCARWWWLMAVMMATARQVPRADLSIKCRWREFNQCRARPPLQPSKRARCMP